MTAIDEASLSVPLPRPIGTLQFLLAWLTPWRAAYGVRAGRSNLKFYLHHRDSIGRHIAKYGTHEPLLTRWFADYLDAAPGSLFVDVGANIGWHAVHAAQHPGVEAVVAFEPDPFNAELLKRNLAANGIRKVTTEIAAVGAAPGEAQLYRYKSSNYGRHTLVADHGFGTATVALVDLDGALARLGFGDRPVAAIKIDVEGYEPAVIAGAARTLERTGAVIVEFSPDLSAAAGLSTNDMLASLDGAGFTPFALRADGGTQRTDVAALQTFAGQLDIIWVRLADASPAVLRVMNEHTSGTMTLSEIAEQNKHVKVA